MTGSVDYAVSYESIGSRLINGYFKFELIFNTSTFQPAKFPPIYSFYSESSNLKIKSNVASHALALYS